MMDDNRAKDHLGNKYPSLRKMCKHYGISLECYKYRLSVGWSKKEALTTPSARKDTTCTDHLGNTYSTEKEMCDAYGIKQNTFERRISANWSIKDALTKKVYPRKKPCKDHFGNLFSSITEMCNYYNIDPYVFFRRKQLGWSLKEALLPDHFTTGKPCYDHLGNQYRSYADLCRKYNIDWGTFKGRRERGWSIEDILTKDIGHKCIDHLGNEYSSMTEMCNKYKISFPMFQKRILDYGWSIEEALTIPKRSSLGEVRIENYLTYRKIEYFHNISIKRLFKELNITQLYDAFLQDITSEFIKKDVKFNKKRIANMRFDFSLIRKNTLYAFIEFDGEQHFYWIDLFFKTIETFLLRHTFDEIKTVFSEEGSIPLLRIRYDQVDYIPEMIDDLLKNPNYYITTHNTYLSNEEYWKPFKMLTEEYAI